MNHCGDCKHWEDFRDRDTEYGECQAVVYIDDLRADHKAFANDGSGNFAALRTRKDFGCVLFEVKPEGRP